MGKWVGVCQETRNSLFFSDSGQQACVYESLSLSLLLFITHTHTQTAKIYKAYLFLLLLFLLRHSPAHTHSRACMRTCRGYSESAHCHTLTMPTMQLSFYILVLLTLSSQLHAAAAAAASVLAPNMSSCFLPSRLPPDETPFRCCAPSAPYSPRLFTPNFSSSPLRVRRPAHLVDEAYAAKLARAYALMQALPYDDPRSFMQQANIHCAYCNAVYNQMNFSLRFEVHGSWLFFPFHRWYLFFHERILGKLLGEADFAIPFWNYDDPEGATLPWLYSTYNITLVDSLRDIHHAPPTPAAIDYTWDTDTRSREKQLRENANAMYRALIRDPTSKQKFFGEPYRAGEQYLETGFGTVEKGPHNHMHLWLGQKSQVGWKDMGALYASARDPAFYAHHALLDRLWEVWKAMPNNYDLDDEDYLEAEFAFYNEDAELVRVKVRDALSTSELGFVYEEVENKWKEVVPVRRSEGEAKLTENDTICVVGEKIKEPCSMVMERDVEGAKGKGEYMEFVMEYGLNEGNHVDVYINLPSANAETDSGCEEYFDYATMMPAFHGGVNSIFVLRTGDFKERLAALELSEASSLVVTLVPRPFDASTALLSLLSASLGIIDSSDMYVSAS